MLRPLRGCTPPDRNRPENNRRRQHTLRRTPGVPCGPCTRRTAPPEIPEQGPEQGPVRPLAPRPTRRPASPKPRHDGPDRRTTPRPAPDEPHGLRIPPVALSSSDGQSAHRRSANRHRAAPRADRYPIARSYGPSSHITEGAANNCGTLEGSPTLAYIPAPHELLAEGSCAIVPTASWLHETSPSDPGPPRWPSAPSSC